MSVSVEAVAEAVVTELNAGQFLLSFVAKHNKEPEFKISEGEINKLKVTVVDIPGATVTRASRAKHYYDYTIHVLAHVKVNDDDYTSGVCREFWQGVLDYMRNRFTLTDLADADEAVTLLKVVEDVMYQLPDDLKTKRVYTGGFGLVYRVTR